MSDLPSSRFHAAPHPSILPVDAVWVVVGRRVDAFDATTRRFPADRESDVQRRLHGLIADRRPVAVLSSAACGADLLALEAAGAAGVPRLVVLPFEPARFRETSVTDRPGDWGPRFDRVMADVAGEEGVVVLDGARSDAEAFLRGNRRMVEEAGTRAAQRGSPVAAVLVWNGESRGPDDLTEDIRREAEARGWPVATILTRAQG